jgi:cytidylate kinase
VNKYRPDSGLADLRYCANDAVAVHQLFESASNMETRILQTDYVDLQELLDGLSPVAKEKLSKDDTIIFQFSGHGYTRNGRDYLAFSTTLPSDNSSALALTDLMASLRQTGAGKFFLILDCCHAIKRNACVTSFRISASTLDSSYDAMIFMGCSLGEISQDHEDLRRNGQGVFTAALCNVVEGYDRIPLYLLEQEVRRETAKICELCDLILQRPQLVGSRSFASYDLLKLERVNLEVARRRIIIVSGPTESGKTTIGQLLQDKLGLAHIEMSRYVRQSHREYIQSTGEIIPLQDYVERVLWANNNFDIVAKRAVNELRETAGDAIITGPRRPEEIAAILDADVDCLLVYLEAKAGMRWSRLVLDSRNAVKGDFKKRNLREIEWGLADAKHLKETEIVRNEESIKSSVETITNLWRKRFDIRLKLGFLRHS